MRARGRAALAVVVLSLAGAGECAELSRNQALEKSLAAVGAVPGNHRFVDPDGNAVTLSELRGRPLVLSLIFTSCDHSCTVTTRVLARRVASAMETLGPERFQVITVGFDARNDTPQRMRDYARRNGVDMPGWRFLSTDVATARALMADVGFSAEPSSRGFDHIAQTTVLDGEGRVYRQIFGEAFELPALVEPLKELIYGGAAGDPRSVQEWVDGLRLLCTVYDPATGRYRFDYSIVMAIGTGTLCLAAILVFLLRSARDLRRASGAAAARDEQRSRMPGVDTPRPS